MPGALKTIIFDLDDTLLNTSETLLPAAQKESWVALKHLGIEVSWEEFLEEWRLSYGEKTPGQDLIETFVFKLRDLGLIDPSDKILKRAREHLTKAFYGREVKERLTLFGGARQTLDSLAQNFKLHLVTSGFAQTQRQKVQGLGIEHLFDSVLYCDLERGEIKRDHFHSLLKRSDQSPSEFLSVGNRRDTDIGPAKSLGMHTCLLLKGEYLHQLPKDKSEIPDFEIEDIRDLIGVCQTLAPACSLSAIPPEGT